MCRAPRCCAELNVSPIFPAAGIQAAQFKPPYFPHHITFCILQSDRKVLLILNTFWMSKKKGKIFKGARLQFGLKLTIFF
jgi:hypothetical protein